MQQSDKGSECHHTLIPQEDSRVTNILSSTNVNNWDLSFLDTRPTSDSLPRKVSDQQSSFTDMSHTGTRTWHNYRNVDAHSYHNVDIHSYQNAEFLALCHPDKIHRFSSPVGVGEIENGFSKGRNNQSFLPITVGTVLHPSRLSSSEAVIVVDSSSQKSIADEDASKLRNSLATVVKKACPRMSLGNPSLISASNHSENVNFSRSSNSSSPRWSSTDGGHVLPGFRSTSSSAAGHFRGSATVHSPDPFYDEIHSDFLGDSDVFDDVQCPMMTSLRDAACTIPIGEPVLWQSVYNIGTSCSSPSIIDAKSKTGKGISSSESIYPHSRKPSSVASSGGGSADSGLSSSSCSDFLSCSQHSPNFSLASELQTDIVSDMGSTVSHPEIRVVNICEESGRHGLDSNRGNCLSRSDSNAHSGALIGMSGLTSQMTSHPTSHITSQATSQVTSHMTSNTTLEITSLSSVLPQPASLTSDVITNSDDVRRLELINHRLTVCRFYFGRMTADEARIRLAPTPIGTYLLRDSSDVRFKYSISVQTTRGPTSIRVGYVSGRFYLDSKPDQLNSIPRFDCVLALVQFYARLNSPSRVRLPSMDCCDVSQHRDAPVMLLKAYEQVGVASLLHLCRRTINGRLEGRSTSRLCLIPSLKGYLNEYPYNF